ncbi:hypothetical protein [Streptomyces sp. H51]|uniref:hypothetical protein n=1 Tax=Streptomyces sp. H51 TaxID=3111770 RepID=UPI002D786DE5|nr:hypothetical protein [Streptomyces sp. H51]
MALVVVLVAVIGVILVAALSATVAAALEEIADAVREKRLLAGAGWICLSSLIVAVLGVMGWAVAANTLFRHQTTVVTASGVRGELKVTRERPVGSDAEETWKYSSIAEVQFDYHPGSQTAEGSMPPQGVVYIHGIDGSRSKVFDGKACPARDLASTVASASRARLKVNAGYRDISSPMSFLTQIRCGIDRPFRPTAWSRYPSEAGRVLDIPFLWRWPWAIPIVMGQIAALVVAVITIGRWRERKCSRLTMISVCVFAALLIVGVNILAARSYGSWPGVLALLALMSNWILKRRLSAGERS